MPAEPNLGLALIVPVTAATAGTAAREVPRWADALRKLGRVYQLILVDDGTADAAVLASLAVGRGVVVRHDSPRGVGACVAAALELVEQPLVATVTLDYPYTPNDLKPILERLWNAEMNAEIAFVGGCRTGRPVPAAWSAVGLLYRGFCRVALGLPQSKLPGWLGFRTHFRAWRAWLVFGSPMADPDCTFTVFRKSAVERFPIQSLHDFVFTEIVAKLTFLEAYLDEVLLTPKPDAVPRANWSDSRAVFRDPQFQKLPAPGVPSPEPVLATDG